MNHGLPASCTATRLQLILGNTLNTHELSLEDKGRASGNWANGTVAIAHLGRDGELTLLTNGHVEEALVPSTYTTPSTIIPQDARHPQIADKVTRPNSTCV